MKNELIEQLQAVGSTEKVKRIVFQYDFKRSGHPIRVEFYDDSALLGFVDTSNLPRTNFFEQENELRSFWAALFDDRKD